MSSGRTPLPVREMAAAAKEASRALASLSESGRNAALEAMAAALTKATEKLLAANARDLQRADGLNGDDALPAATRSRLTLSEAKLTEMIAQVRSVAALPDPLGRTLDAIELDNEDPAGFARGAAQGLRLVKTGVPLGVLATIFEARPDAVTQIVSLAVKSGNAVVLKPGSEVAATAEAIVDVLQEALVAAGLPPASVGLLHGREATAELLALHELVDMVIPRGSRQLVEYVQANTRIPVLGHAEGVCHIYVDKDADTELALRVIEDAKCDYPAACNAVETVLIHEEIAEEFLPKLAVRLAAHNVEMHGDDFVIAELGESEILPVDDWHTEYGSLAISIGVVESLDAAMEHIHRYGSLHTESILTENAETAERFLREVDAAGVFHNASTRFADGFRYGFGAEVGVSTSKFHARGPVGLEGLTTYKYILRGHGHVAGDYRGASARPFTHRR